MEAQEFIDLIEVPEKAKEKGIDELKKLAHDFPYSQPIQLMYAIRLRKSSEHLFNQQLGRASILTNDRSVLFDLFEKGGISTLTKEEEEELLHPKPELNEPMVTQPPSITIPYEEKEEKSEKTKKVEEAYIPVKSIEVNNTAEEEEEDLEKPSEENEKKDHSDVDVESLDTDTPRKEKNIAALPADERIKAILEKNRRLREEFESRKLKDESPLSEMDQRLQKIREKLQALKQPVQKENKKLEEKEWSENLPEPMQVDSLLPVSKVDASTTQVELESIEAGVNSEDNSKEGAAKTCEYSEEVNPIQENQNLKPVEEEQNKEEAAVTLEPFAFNIESDENDVFEEGDSAQKKEENFSALDDEETPLFEEASLVGENIQETKNVFVDENLDDDRQNEAFAGKEQKSADKAKEEDLELEEAAQIEEHNHYDNSTVKLVERAEVELEKNEVEVDKQVGFESIDLKKIIDRENRETFSPKEEHEDTGDLEQEVLLEQKNDSDGQNLQLVELAEEVGEEIINSTNSEVSEEDDSGITESREEDNQEEFEAQQEVSVDNTEEDRLEEEEKDFDPQRDKYRLTPLDIDDDLIKDVAEHRREEHMSFSKWLKKLNKGGGSSLERVKGRLDVSNQPEKPVAFEEKVQLLDSFVEKLPTLKKKKIAAGPAKTPVEIGRLVSKGETASLVTETLAFVYTEQRHYDKAIKAYEILKLKYPEKSSFFAARISEVKKLKNN